MDPLKIISVFVFIVLLLMPSIGFSQSEEYILKGVTIEKFTRFIDWPNVEDMGDTTRPFVIGIFGETIFSKILGELYRDQKIKKKKVVILEFSNTQNLDQCQLLFIAKSERQNIKRIIETISRRPILTIGDTDDFGEKGIHINFYIENKKLRFEINETAIKSSNFRVSYLLLKHAKIIKPWGNHK